MKHLTNFSLFTAVGAVFYFIAIAVNTLLIESLSLPTFWAASGSLCALFLLKYFISVWLGIVHNHFGRYALGNILMSLLSALLIWVSVDVFQLHAALSTGIVLGVVFILRWFVLASLGVLKIGENHPNDAASRLSADPTTPIH